MLDKSLILVFEQNFRTYCYLATLFFIFTEDVGTHTPYLESGRHSATDLLDATRGLFCKVLLLRHAALYKQNSSTFIIALLSLPLWSQIILQFKV